MTEAFLQYVWLHRLMRGELTTTDGQPICILRAGELNTNAGPDFLNARLQIGDTLWAGNVEIHIKTSHWDCHKHTKDKNYNNVILHVVWEHDCTITTENGNKLPTLELKRHIPEYVWEQYDALLNATSTDSIRCHNRLVDIPKWRMESYLTRMAIERMERKTEDTKRLLADAKGSWETCCYWLMARYFGGKTNAFPFELLAKTCDLRLLARWKDNLQRIEALLYGQAGLLEGDFEDDYPQQLQADYEAIRIGGKLTPISGHLWRTYRMRPSSFPTLRISQFAHLVTQSNNLFQYLLEQTSISKIEELFSLEASPYWNTHYQFDKPSKECPKRLGKDFADLLIMNAWVPLLIEYGNQHGQPEYKEQALNLLQQLQPENNNIIRLWQQYDISPENAIHTQALLELHNEYCQKRKCADCQIGFQLISKK